MKHFQLTLITVLLTIFATRPVQSETSATNIITVPDDISTIQGALDRAVDGDTIYIKNGTYTEFLSLAKKDRIHIQGESRDGVIIQQDISEPDIFTIDVCPVVLLSNLTFQRLGNHDDHNPNSNTTAINAAGSSLEISNCHFNKIGDRGIHGYGKHFTLKNCLFENSIMEGSAYWTPECIVENCTFQNISSNGIHLEFCKGFVTNNKFINCTAGLIVCNANQTITISNNLISGCKHGSLFISREPSHPNYKKFEPNAPVRYIITDNILENCDGYSIFFRDNVGQFEISKTQCVNNKDYGIYIAKALEGKIEHCQIARSKKIGLAVAENSNLEKLLCANNVIENNGENGIYIKGIKNLEINHNQLKNNGYDDMQIVEITKTLAIRHNTCMNPNRCGIALENLSCTSCSITNNHIENSNQPSIYIKRCKQGGDVTGNYCESKCRGIDCVDSANFQISNNTCSNNTENGINVHHSLEIIVKSNQCQQNQMDGILVNEESKDIQLVNNFCEYNNYSGILIQKSSVAVIHNNQCHNNRWAGIGLRGIRSSANLTDNSANDNGAWGIIAWAGAEATLENNNQAQNNALGGIQIEPGDPEELATQWQALGDDCLAKKDFRQALDYYRQAVEVNPDGFDGYNMLAWSAIQLANSNDPNQNISLHQEAHKAFERAVELGPWSVDALIGLGQTALRLSYSQRDQKITLLEQSVASYRKAYEYRPTLPGAATGYAYALYYTYFTDTRYNQNSPERKLAADICRVALNVAPQDEILLTVVGCDYINQAHQLDGDQRRYCLQQAEQLFLRIDQLTEKLGGAAYNLACVYALLGDEAKCLANLKNSTTKTRSIDADYIEQDPDLAAMKDKPWFREFIDSIKPSDSKPSGNESQ